MLILTRRPGENVQIKLKDGEIITVSSLGVKGNQTRLGISAPKDLVILRNELVEKDGGWEKIQ
jgi:carbon storage regulator